MRSWLVICAVCSMHIDAAHPFGDGDGVDAADEDLCEADPLEGLDASTRGALTSATALLDASMSWTLTAADAARFAASDAGDRASTLGFTTAGGARAMLEHAAARLAPKKPKRFLDLGSGAGHTVLYFAVLDPSLECVGHELSAERVASSRDALRRLDEERPDLDLANRVTFVQGDMTLADTSGFDIVWASTLALGDGLRLRLAEKLVAELDAGVALYSSIKLVAGSSETPLVVANSWSHAHEVEVALMDADTAVAPHLREAATRRRSADF